MKILFLGVGERKPPIEMTMESSLSAVGRLMNARELKQTTFYCFGKPFCVFYDADRLSQPPIVSVFSSRDGRMLVGNIVITGAEDNEGRFSDLTDEDIESLRSCCMLSCGYYFLLLK
ncbi:MAG: hypothetical protein J6A63_10875 [Clostridia bacterium]|nr:hypothetical protein [Clostridia bacterium]